MTGGTDDEIINNYRSGIAAYVDGLLSPYVEGLKSLAGSSKRGVSKEFNDPVWGTIALEPQEVIVLDSPLLQRLRRIRQLGVAHLVYPGAVHTRLEHSIGVCNQVGRLVDSINSHRRATGTGPDTAPLDERVRRLLRLTGLCHDIGHGLMSHVIENALKNDETCNELLLAFKKKLAKDGTPQLSEIAAHCMAQTPTFEELLAEAYRVAGLPAEPDLAQRLSNLIVGISTDNSMPLLHELISGPFDADKLDYMPRDATMCGVPVVTDVDRLIQKVRAVRLAAQNLPPELAHAVPQGSANAMYTVVGLAPSGASTLDEVAFGRSLMFDKIYRHHKVRAAEAMVAAIIDKVGGLIEPNRALLPLRIFDDELLSLPMTGLAGTACNAQYHIGLDIADRFARRELFVRAFAFSQHLPNDPYRGRADQREAIEKLCRETNTASGRHRFVEKIVQVTEAMVALLDDSPDLGIYGGDVSAYIWVDPPASSIPNANPDTNHAYLIDHDDVPRRVGQVNPQTRGWADAYVNTRDMGYVFTVRELAPIVHIAAEISARTIYGARIHDQARLYSKQQAEQLNSIRINLADRGFYDDFPHDLRPLPEALRLLDSPARLETVVSNLHGYQPPGTGQIGELGKDAFNSVHVSDWVRQFKPEFAEYALRTAESVRLIGRADTHEAINSFFNQSADGFLDGGASLVPMGGPKDGASIVGYYSRTAAILNNCDVRDVESALTRAEPIILVDDFIGRGSTAISFFEGLLDLPDTQYLGQDRPDPLDEEMAERLRSRPVALVFSAGLDGAEDSVRAQLSSYGMEDVRVFVHRTQSELPTLNSSLPPGPERDAFTAECRRIGEQLIAGPEVPDSTAEERSLGYGNHGLLVVFPYNTPTATLTVLWKAGVTDQQPWQPLLPRLKKT